MRILILADASVSHPYKWAKILEDLGNDVRILTFEKPLNPDLAESLNLPLGKFKYIFGMPKVAGYIERFKPHILFSHFLPNYGFISSFFKGFKILALWGSDIMAWPYKSPLHKKLAQNILKKFNIIVCDALVVRDILVKDFGILSEKIYVIPFGVEREIREKPLKDLPTDVLTFVSTRRIEKLFNHFEILRFIKKLSERFKVKILYLNDGSLREEVIRFAKDMKINFEYLGKVPYEKYVEVLQNSHFCISIPSRDATSVSLLECMALGSVPLVSDIPANREWVDDNGILTKPNADEMFKGFINRFNWDWWKRARVSNKKIVMERCNWEENVKGFWFNVFKELSV